MAKYKTVEKNGVTYYRTTFTYNEKKYDLIAKTTQELDDKVQKKKQALEERDINNSDIRVKDWAVQWLETYKKPHIGRKHYTDYKGYVNNRIIPAIGNMKMKDVQQIHLQNLLNGLSDYSYSYVNHVKTTLTGMFSVALNNKIVKYNSAQGLSTSKALPKGSHRVITEVEEIELLKVCETHHFGLFPLFMLYCGLRNGEVTALTWGDIDIDQRIVNVNKGTEAGSSTSVKAPKTKSGIRKVPIPEIFIERLKQGKEGKNPHELVVTTLKGKMCYHSFTLRYWNDIKRNMDINIGAKVEKKKIIESALWLDKDLEESFTPYCLRHTYCTNLFKAGIHINVAKYLMGHASTDMVTKIYGHQTDDMTADALKLIDIYQSQKK